MSNCKALMLMKQAIDNGADPEQVIPYNIDCQDPDDYLEILYYARQVLRADSRRIPVINKKIEELEHVRRAESEL